jgi:hypothetical protein
VDSYSFSAEERGGEVRRAMVPVLDLINHAHDANAVFSKDWTTGAYAITASRHIR